MQIWQIFINLMNISKLASLREMDVGKSKEYTDTHTCTYAHTWTRKKIYPKNLPTLIEVFRIQD